jgi:hypothetical protein
MGELVKQTHNSSAHKNCALILTTNNGRMHNKINATPNIFLPLPHVCKQPNKFAIMQEIYAHVCGVSLLNQRLQLLEDFLNDA